MVMGGGGYTYQTSHYSSHKPGDYGILLCLSVASSYLHTSVNSD